MLITCGEPPLVLISARDEIYNFATIYLPMRAAPGSKNKKREEKTQRELARRLRKPHSFVSKYETRVRRLDPVEFLDIAETLGIDPCKSPVSIPNTKRTIPKSRLTKPLTRDLVPLADALEPLALFFLQKHLLRSH